MEIINQILWTVVEADVYTSPVVSSIFSLPVSDASDFFAHGTYSEVLRVPSNQDRFRVFVGKLHNSFQVLFFNQFLQESFGWCPVVVVAIVFNLFVQSSLSRFSSPNTFKSLRYPSRSLTTSAQLVFSCVNSSSNARIRPSWTTTKFANFSLVTVFLHRTIRQSFSV